jgi:hypothetical protein
MKDDLEQKDEKDEPVKETEVKVEGLDGKVEGLDGNVVPNSSVKMYQNTDMHTAHISELDTFLHQNPKWTLLEDNINSLILGDMSLLIETGEAGMGKSFRTKQILQKNIPKDFMFFNCHITPLEFYAQLFKHKDKKVIVFDDIDSVADNTIIALLKNACWNPEGEERTIKWLTTSLAFLRLKVPDEFTLEAKIILIFNDENTSKEFKPILSRGIHLPFNFTFEEKIAEFEKIAKDSHIDKEILKYIREKCSPATTGLSTRAMVILSNKKRSGTDWEGTARAILKADPFKELLIEMINNSKGKKMEDICKEWCKKTDLSRKTFFNWKKILIDYEERVKLQSNAIKMLQPIENEEKEKGKK